jgi:hypothetical protein
MGLLEDWGGVVLGVVLLAVLLRGALLEAAREPRRAATELADSRQADTEPDDPAGPHVDIRLVVLMVLVLATLGPRLVSLLV